MFYLKKKKKKKMLDFRCVRIYWTAWLRIGRGYVSDIFSMSTWQHLCCISALFCCMTQRCRMLTWLSVCCMQGAQVCHNVTCIYNKRWTLRTWHMPTCLQYQVLKSISKMKSFSKCAYLQKHFKWLETESV